MPELQQKRVLVLGAYGLIGQALARFLMDQDHAVVCFGRNSDTAQRTFPSAEWVLGDLKDLQSSESWKSLLTDIDFVVNCAGALQDNRNDDLEAVHHTSIKSLAGECATLGIGLIQISASGAHADAATHCGYFHPARREVQRLAVTIWGHAACTQHAEAFAAPELLIHGRNDTVVSKDQSRIMQKALRKADKPLRLAWLKGEDRWLAQAETRLQTQQEVDRFLQPHLFSP